MGRCRHSGSCTASRTKESRAPQGLALPPAFSLAQATWWPRGLAPVLNGLFLSVLFRLFVNPWVSCPVPSLNTLFTWRAEEAALGYVRTECCCAVRWGGGGLLPHAPARPAPSAPLCPSPSSAPPRALCSALPLHLLLSPPWARCSRAGLEPNLPARLLRGPCIPWREESGRGLALKLSCSPGRHVLGLRTSCPSWG